MLHSFHISIVTENAACVQFVFITYAGSVNTYQYDIYKFETMHEVCVGSLPFPCLCPPYNGTHPSDSEATPAGSPNAVRLRK